MKTIKVNNKELLLVPVDGYKNENSILTRDYEIVNILSKLTEEQAKDMMIKQGYRLWYNYINETFCVLTALESFNSLMIANEIDTNNEYLILVKND